ncbi:unnamed protein product, partial [Mycena citricolor]
LVPSAPSHPIPSQLDSAALLFRYMDEDKKLDPDVSDQQSTDSRLDPRIRRKIDLRVIPLITLLYLCCFLDRSNLGNARIAGMAEDLDLTGMRYQMAAAAFFVTYALLEAPCNVVAKCVRPSIWIPGLTLAWGIIMVSMAFVKTWRGLIIARVFLGVAESGLAPALGEMCTGRMSPVALGFS